MTEAPQHTEPRKESLISKIDGVKDIWVLLSGPGKSELITSLNTPDFKDKLSATLWEGLKKSITNIAKNGISNEQDASIVNTYGVLLLGKNVDSLSSSSGDAEESAQQTLSEIQEKNMKEYMLQNINSSWLNGETFNNLVQSVSGLKIDEDSDGVVSEEEKQEYKWNLEANVPEENLGEQEKVKRREILDRIMNYNFDTNHGLRFEMNNNGQKTVYESLDQHNPELTQQDFSKELKNVTDKYRKELGGTNPINPDKENTRENLKKMITEYFEQNKESLEKMGITDITHLTPQQATKLVSIITMDKLGYDYAQAISPGDEENYIGNLDEQEKSAFTKSKDWYINLVGETIRLKNHYPEYKDKNVWEFVDAIQKDKSKANIYEAFQKIGEKVNNKDYSWLSEKEKEETIKEDIVSVRNFYLGNSDFHLDHTKADNLSTDELLKAWKWVCRNYGTANEKLFDALKDMQDKSNDLLKNSHLTGFTDVKWHDYRKDIYQAWEKETRGFLGDWWSWHAWNLLTTIDKNGVVHKTQIDSTIADNQNTSEKVRVLDCTNDRLIQDLTKEWVDPKEAGINLLKLYLSLDISNLDEKQKKLVWSKINTLIASSALDINDTLEYLSKTEFNHGKLDADVGTQLNMQRFKLIKKSIENKNYDLALKALWKVPDWSEANLLKIALTMLQSGTDSIGIDMFEKDEVLQEKVANMTESEFKDRFNAFFGIGNYLIKHKVIDPQIFKTP